MEAESAEMVAEQLFNTHLTPIDIQPVTEKPVLVAGPRFPALARLFRPRVQLDELIMLCRQLHTLMKAGVPILRSLSALIETTRNPTLAEALRSVSDDLQAGRELHAALARKSDIFPPLFVSLVRVGENTGRLDEVFVSLAGYLELEKNTRDQIKNATRYPLIVITAIVAALVVINIWVIPAFASAFSRFGAELPWATQILLGISEFTLQWWQYMLVITVGAVVGFRFWIQSRAGEYLWSKTLLRIPMVGPILLKATLGRFARSFAMALKSGVPLVKSLTVIAGVVDNAFIGERILSMRDGIESGDSISRTAAATGLFTPLVQQMIAVGEESGSVDELLLETAGHYEREVTYELKRLSDAIEPIIIMVIGVMVLILALGVFLPMWDLSTAIKG
jgi:MSHA biogenesis protein MshG